MNFSKNLQPQIISSIFYNVLKRSQFLLSLSYLNIFPDEIHWGYERKDQPHLFNIVCQTRELLVLLLARLVFRNACILCWLQFVVLLCVYFTYVARTQTSIILQSKQVLCHFVLEVVFICPVKLVTVGCLVVLLLLLYLCLCVGSVIGSLRRGSQPSYVSNRWP